jgi:bile acid-coenzyme A ligase
MRGACAARGSTGTPKAIVINNPGVYLPESGANTVDEAWGPLRRPQRILVPAPLHHTNGFTATRNLMGGEQIVLLDRFNAPRVLDLIEHHRITGFIAATLMLQRLAQVPGIDERDLSSLQWVQQGASPLPVWLGRRWCELVGPEHFYLSYGASEMHGLVICRGDEWLEHPGTLGRGFTDTEIRVLDADNRELPAGEVGRHLHEDPDRTGRVLRGRRRHADAPHRRRVRDRGRSGLGRRRGLSLHGRPTDRHDRYRRH